MASLLEDVPRMGQLGEPKPGRVLRVGVVRDIRDDVEVISDNYSGRSATTILAGRSPS
ncbi:MAG TPA: hypothetical protein VG963_08300 [Polyangiaceae bacterium]|nr:hypothetical protein [Polyangiaceae bacterium]